MNILLEFVGLFAFILVMGYILPAGSYFWRFYVRPKPSAAARRIQHREPTREGIKREIKLSLSTIVIFAIIATITLELYLAGYTQMYTEVRSYPFIRFPLSVIACMVLHDTYFYWSHRFMHWKPVFKWTHAGHHRSMAPTPWAIFAFQPGEAVIQGLGVAMLLFVVPMHPLAFGLFLFLDTHMNTAGHSGYEVIPKRLSQSIFYRGFNTVTHHDAHHTNFGKNFGSFFNIWDRLMGTFQDGVTPANPVPEGSVHAASRAKLERERKEIELHDEASLTH